MDYLIITGILVMVAVFEPGNKELNETCRQEVVDGIHESMIQCREWYRPSR